MCYVTGATYKDDVLGFGVKIQGALLQTPAELLSYGAFKNGAKTSSIKESFTHFLPAFICKSHANDNWKKVSELCLDQIFKSYKQSFKPLANK